MSRGDPAEYGGKGNAIIQKIAPADLCRNHELSGRSEHHGALEMSVKSQKAGTTVDFLLRWRTCLSGNT